MVCNATFDVAESLARHTLTYSGLLTTGDSQPKTSLGEVEGVYTAALHLAPAATAGMGNVCPYATDDCRFLCLNESGHAAIVKRGEESNDVLRARARRTHLFFTQRARFIAALRKAIGRHVLAAQKRGMRPAVRLNATSDLAYEAFAPEIFREFPGVQFYDYTKGAARFRKFLDGKFPPNYHLTFSYSEANAADCAEFLRRGGNVAIVFAEDTLPTTFCGFPVIDGLRTDLRFTDPKGTIVGLLPKGPKAKAFAKRVRKGELSARFIVRADEGVLA